MEAFRAAGGLDKLKEGQPPKEKAATDSIVPKKDDVKTLVSWPHAFAFFLSFPFSLKYKF